MVNIQNNYYYYIKNGRTFVLSLKKKIKQMWLNKCKRKSTNSKLKQTIKQKHKKKIGMNLLFAVESDNYYYYYRWNFWNVIGGRIVLPNTNVLLCAKSKIADWRVFGYIFLWKSQTFVIHHIYPSRICKSECKISKLDSKIVWVKQIFEEK